jgi:hypothetical protein
MTVKPFPFTTDGVHGDVPNNFYPAADSEKGIILFPTPGLQLLCQLTDCTEVRGLYAWSSYLYALARRGAETILWRVDQAGGAAELGTITTSSSGPVWMKNNATQLCVVDGVSGFIYTPSTGIFGQITDAAFPGASSMDYQDSYGLFTSPSSNEWFFSAINDFSTFDAGDFYSIEGKPGNIMCVLSDHREPWFFKNGSTEVWYNAGGDNTSVSNPTFARTSGGLLEFGCGAVKTPAQFDNAIAWLSNKGQLLRGQGYNAQIFSTDKFGREIGGYTTFSDAIAFSYTDLEHEFYQITFPTADKTWVFDAKTKLFHKKQSWKTGGEFGRHRANCYAFLNNTHYVGDYSNGKIYTMSTDHLDDDGEEIQRILYSMEVDNGMKRMFFPSVQITFKPGVGLESGIDPQAMLQFSGDSGKTWSSELWRSVGKIGEYGKRSVWNRMGSGFQRIYRLTVTDPVEWMVIGIDWWKK